MHVSRANIHNQDASAGSLRNVTTYETHQPRSAMHQEPLHPVALEAVKHLYTKT